MSLGGSEAAALLEKHGISPRKAFGQNFVVDPNTINRIVRFAGIEPGDHVVEIGPGLGSLTGEIADAGAAEVVAVEVDGALIPALKEHLGNRDVRVVHADASDLEWAGELDASFDWKLVANLPYNVGTSLVLDILTEVPAVTSLTVMVQREVAERLAAEPNTAEFGIPSVVVRYWATAKICGRVPPTVFLPQPRVESAVVTLTRRPDRVVDTETQQGFVELMALVRAAFGKRRKMLRSSLGSLVPFDAFSAAGIEPTQRPAELDVDDWHRLSQAVTA